MENFKIRSLEASGSSGEGEWLNASNAFKLSKLSIPFNLERRIFYRCAVSRFHSSVVK